MGNFLGIKNDYIIENIDILASHHLSEAVDIFVKFVMNKPVFFRKQRDQLRVRSLEALLEMDCGQELRSIVPLLSKDYNSRIRTLALKAQKDEH